MQRVSAPEVVGRAAAAAELVGHRRHERRVHVLGLASERGGGVAEGAVVEGLREAFPVLDEEIIVEKELAFGDAFL